MTEADRLRAAFEGLIAGLTTAGASVEAAHRGRTDEERADAYRALLRAFGSNLGKLEADPAHPWPLHVNPPNQKWFIDNPDGVTLHCQLDPTKSYRLYGRLGAARYTSITTYEGRGEGLATRATATRTDRDLDVGEDGSIDLVLSAEPGSGRSHLQLTSGTGQLWIRQLYDDIHHDEPGWFRIEPIGASEPPRAVDPEALASGMRRLGKSIPMLTQVMLGAFRMQFARHPANQVRVWEEMRGGAFFTSDDIEYAIGRFELAEGESLVLRGTLPRCRHWNVVLYSPVLNSLEHRYRSTSLTGGRLRTDARGEYAIHVAASRPEGATNWLDTEGRVEGLFVLRITGADSATPLPTATLERRGGE